MISDITSAPEPSPDTDALLSGIKGLDDAEVAQKIEQGNVNRTQRQTSRSFASILRTNIFTRFNAILGVLLVIILTVGSPHDALFGIVIIFNTAIGIIQEWRAKITLDRLSLLSAVDVQVMRGGVLLTLPPVEIVTGDMIIASQGGQIMADGQLHATEGLEIDESLLTGEAAPILKKTGDNLLSGSFVVAGRGVYQTTNVGEDAYAAKLAKEARQFHLARSELQDSINLLLRIITWIMFPVAIALFLTEYNLSGSFDIALVSSVSGLVGMIPQGLVLLTSMAFAVSIIRLGRRKVLVQELPAVEALARVDVFCFDKTGSLTTGRFVLDRIEPVQPSLPVEAALGAFAETFDSSQDPMLEILAQSVANPHWTMVKKTPFSPGRKWSSAEFETHGTWVLGAPEVILESTCASDAIRRQYHDLAAAGYRVLLLAKSSARVVSDILPELTLATLVVLQEQLRLDAPETIAYFKSQNVELKVISGDSPLTAAAIARKAGIGNAQHPVDGAELPDDREALSRIMADHSVFGRIGPQQKKHMIEALQARGHTVAMLGDGVNDVLAIKQADLGIAVGTAAAASKAVAQIILTDGKFSVLPQVVAEGRRILANIERVAALFVTKTVYATLLIVAVSLLQWPFPLLPRHFTLIDAFTIGIPAFFLSLGPARQRFRPGMLGRLMRFTLPAGTILASAVIAGMAVSRSGVPLEVYRSLATLILCVLGLVVLTLIARPLVSWRGLLVVAMAAGIAAAFLLPVSRQFFALSLTPELNWYFLILSILTAGIILSVVIKISEKSSSQQE